MKSLRCFQSKDKEDKAQTLSITLRQGNTQELPWRYYHYSDELEGVEGRVWSSFSTLLPQSLTQLTRKKKKNYCVTMSKCSCNRIWQPLCTSCFVFTLQGSQRMLLCLQALLPILNRVTSGWNTDCIPTMLCPVWVMNSILLQLAAGLYTQDEWFSSRVPLQFSNMVMWDLNGLLHSGSHNF